MTSGPSLRSTGYGRAVGLRLEPSVPRPTPAQLPWWWQESPDAQPERWWTVRTAEETDAVVAALELWVAEHARDVVFVHAAVAEAQGRVVLLPGRSRTGKTTLALALRERGATVWSDEYAVLTRDGQVRPYPRDLRPRLGNPLATGPVPADAPPAEVAHPVAGVAHLVWQPGAEWSAAVLSAGENVLGLLEQTVAARSRPREVLPALRHVAEGAWSVGGVRGDPVDAADRLLSLLLEACPC